MEHHSIDLEKKDWSLITIAANGTVSTLANHSLASVKSLYEKFKPREGYPAIQRDSGEIVRRFVVGPSGWDGCLTSAHHAWNILEEAPISAPGSVNDGAIQIFRECSNCGERQLFLKEYGPPISEM